MPAGVVILAGDGLDDIDVVGESYHAAASRRLFLANRMPGGGTLYRVAVLEREPRNEYDPNAVKVMVEGEHVGYVPRDRAKQMAERLKKVGWRHKAGLYARIWCDPGAKDIGWGYASVTLFLEDPVPRLGSDESLAEVGERERRRREAGLVDGQYWETFKAAVAELKKLEQFDAALAIVERCVDAAERVSQVAGEIPDSWPTAQAVLILRKLKRSELAVLERYAAACGNRPMPDRIVSYLTRARAVAH